VLVELIGEVAFAAAPLGPQDAARLLEQPRLARALAGLRGSAPVDRAALVALVCRVGDLLAAHPQVRSLDLNPVLAGPEGLVAVDWRLELGSAWRGESAPHDSSPAAEAGGADRGLASRGSSPRRAEETP
jgi:hypothetical protein